MLGYDYKNMYKKVKENVMVDYLSRKFEEDGSFFGLSLLIIGWPKKFHQEWMENDTIVQFIQRI